MVDGELLFYTRERAPEEARRLHHVVIDASASMRGEREVFARGAWPSRWPRSSSWRARKCGCVSSIRVSTKCSGRASVHRFRPHGCWVSKGSRGRQPARVFAQLATETALLRARDSREPVVHLITHAALHIPRALVQEVRRQAHVFAVFILPSGGELDLEWLDLLEGYAVVDHATLNRKARAPRRPARSWTSSSKAPFRGVERHGASRAHSCANGSLVFSRGRRAPPRACGAHPRENALPRVC